MTITNTLRISQLTFTFLLQNFNFLGRPKPNAYPNVHTNQQKVCKAHCLLPTFLFLSRKIPRLHGNFLHQMQTWVIGLSSHRCHRISQNAYFASNGCRTNLFLLVVFKQNKITMPSASSFKRLTNTLEQLRAHLPCVPAMHGCVFSQFDPKPIQIGDLSNILQLIQARLHDKAVSANVHIQSARVHTAHFC